MISPRRRASAEPPAQPSDAEIDDAAIAGEFGDTREVAAFQDSTLLDAGEIEALGDQQLGR